MGDPQKQPGGIIMTKIKFKSTATAMMNNGKTQTMVDALHSREPKTNCNLLTV